MWRIAKVCPNCLEGLFDKSEEDGSLICTCCGESYDDMDDLENMDYWNDY